MSYERQILQILAEVGTRGISARALVKHVYNMNCTLFGTPDMDELKRSVRSYLAGQLRHKYPLVERTGRRGYYRLNTNGSAQARQLLLEFGSEPNAGDTPAEEKPELQQDQSLSLFD